MEVRVFHLVWIFLIASFVGLLGETVVSYFIDGRWESRVGFVLGPLSPIYGAGVVLFTVFANPIRSQPVPMLFLVSALVGGAFEYLAGWFLEYRYGIVAWSYVDQPLNINGRTCAAIMAVWGSIGTAWVIWVLPKATAFVERIPEHMRFSLTVAALACIAADTACTLMAFDCWFLRTSGHEPANALQRFFATFFDDTFMQTRFETMSMWPVLAGR